MRNRICPVPNCTGAVPAGPNAVFCLEHFFRLPHRVTAGIVALKFTCSRTENDDETAHLRDQIDAYVRLAVRSIAERADAA